jgi:hypothetical protein
MLGGGSGLVTRYQLLELIAAGRALAKLPVDPAVLVVTPPDEGIRLADVDGMIGAERDVGQDDGDRVRLIPRVDPASQRPARRFDRHCRRQAAEGTGRFRIRRDHHHIASRTTFPPRNQASISECLPNACAARLRLVRLQLAVWWIITRAT